MEHIQKTHDLCNKHKCAGINNTKCCIIGVEGEEPSFTIEDYFIFEKKNVFAIDIKERENYGWDVFYTDNTQSNIINYYFCIDGIYHEAWSHWVEESALYLPLFLKLRRIFPNIKLYSFKKKGYKDAMYKSFGLSENDISYFIENTSNVFYFPRYISLADHRRPFLFLKYMKTFYSWITEKIPPKEKDIELLYLPRGSKENCRENDRQIPVQLELIHALSQYPQVKILYTDSTEDMLEQWSIVRRAKVILLNEGSSLLVNGFFSINSKIIVLGGHGNNAHLWNPSPALVYFDSIHRGNSYYHIPYEWPLQMVLNKLSGVMNSVVPAEALPKFKCYRDCKYCKYQEIETYSENRSILLNI